MSEKISRVECGRVSTGVEFDPKKGEAVPATLRPLRFLGMGLLIAWLCCTHINSIYIGGPGEIRLAAETGMRMGDIGTFLVMAAFSRRIGVLSSHWKSMTTLVALTALGTGITGLLLVPTGTPEEVFVASIATAMGGAVLFCLWAEVFCQMGGNLHGRLRRRILRDGVRSIRRYFHDGAALCRRRDGASSCDLAPMCMDELQDRSS